MRWSSSAVVLPPIGSVRSCCPAALPVRLVCGNQLSRVHPLIIAAAAAAAEARTPPAPHGSQKLPPTGRAVRIIDMKIRKKGTENCSIMCTTEETGMACACGWACPGQGTGPHGPGPHRPWGPYWPRPGVYWHRPGVYWHRGPMGHMSRHCSRLPPPRASRIQALREHQHLCRPALRGSNAHLWPCPDHSQPCSTHPPSKYELKDSAIHVGALRLCGGGATARDM